MCLIEVFEIASQKENGFPFFNWREIFSLGAAKQVETETVLQNGWTLFGFDFENAVAIFLDVGPDLNLSIAPFCYDEQVKQAKGVAVVSFQEFVQLASQIEIDHLQIVQLYSMGHCGSTLLHNVFNKVPDAWCISEPKVFFDLAIWRYETNPALMLNLADAALKFVTLFPFASLAKVLVIKHFSQVNAILPVMRAISPRAQNLFLYRDGISWANSFYGFAQRNAGVKMKIAPELREFSWRVISGNAPLSDLNGLVDLKAETVTFDSLVAIAWVLHVRNFTKAREAKMNFFAVRYDELTGDRLTVIRQILSYCGMNPDFGETSLVAFDIDSHLGTKTSHDIEVSKFDDENYRRIEDIYANPRVSLDPKMMLPNADIR
jgi:hypothetical protein